MIKEKLTEEYYFFKYELIRLKENLIKTFKHLFTEKTIVNVLLFLFILSLINRERFTKYVFLLYLIWYYYIRKKSGDYKGYKRKEEKIESINKKLKENYGDEYYLK